MTATILRFPTQLRVVPEPTLAQRFRASLTHAPSDWQGQRVVVRALCITGRVEGWCAELGKLAVAYDDGECGFYDASDLTRIGSQPQGDGMPGDCT